MFEVTRRVGGHVGSEPGLVCASSAAELTCARDIRGRPPELCPRPGLDRECAELSSDEKVACGGVRGQRSWGAEGRMRLERGRTVTGTVFKGRVCGRQFRIFARFQEIMLHSVISAAESLLCSTDLEINGL